MQPYGWGSIRGSWLLWRFLWSMVTCPILSRFSIIHVIHVIHVLPPTWFHLQHFASFAHFPHHRIVIWIVESWSEYDWICEHMIVYVNCEWESALSRNLSVRDFSLRTSEDVMIFLKAIWIWTFSLETSFMLVIGAFHSAYFRSLLAGGWFFGQKCGKELPFQQMDERKGLEGMGLNWHFIYFHTIILYFHFILIAQVQTCSIHHHSSRGTLDLRRCQKKLQKNVAGNTARSGWMQSNWHDTALVTWMPLTRHLSCLHSSKS